MLYQISPERFFRLHHVRPRFKGQVEDVLIYMAREIVRIGEQPKMEFASLLNRSIRHFPGNANLEKKTLDNWRTEISALFGLICKDEGTVWPSLLAIELAESSDLISFFRTYLAKFQYPGGHVKAQYAAECINAGVRFKPASFVIRVLLAGQAKSENGKFSIDKREATALIWNDLLVTTGKKTPDSVAEDLIELRRRNVEFDSAGDVVRYAGDILDYMVLANILSFHPSGSYSLIPGVQEAANMILSNEKLFPPYERLYGSKNLDAQVLRQFETEWFDYAGNQIQNLVLDTDPLSVLEGYVSSSGPEIDSVVESIPAEETNHETPIELELLAFLREKLHTGVKIQTKETGNAGEFLVLKHEYNRLEALGAKDQAKKVKKIPDHLGVGYDIKSFEDASETQRLIEVKTSISHGKLKVSQFHLTKNEWKAAEASGANYFVFRILISTKSVSCFVIHDPVAKYKNNLMKMNIGDGADIEYKEEAGYWQKLMLT